MYHLLWSIHFYQKYTVLDFERNQRPLTWNTNARRIPLPIFRRYETFPPPFGFVRHFSAIFKMSSKGPFLFWYFATGWMFKKFKRVPLLNFLALWDCSKFSFIVFFQENFQIFESILMSPKGRSFICLIFCNKRVSKSPKSPTFYNFKNFALFEFWIQRRL